MSLRKSVRFNRVSSKEQREGYSLDAQEKLSNGYAKANRLKIIESWSVDESATKEKDRKFFFQMVKFVKENEIKDIIFDKVDRACRGYKSAAMVDELINEHDVCFHFVRENLVVHRHSSPTDKMRLGIGVVLGKWQIDNLKLEVRKGMEERQSKGYWNFKAPLGYLNVRAKGKASVVLDDDSYPYVKQAFELYSTGNYSIEALQSFLRKNIKNSKISSSALENLLANPFYYGDMRVKGKVLPGNHDPLITKELWDNCQRIRGIRAAKMKLTEKANMKKPFMGLMRCCSCGRSVTGEVKKKRSGKTYIYYHCANTKCSERSKNIPQQQIMDQVTEAFRPFSKLTPRGTARLLEEVKSKVQDLESLSEKKLDELLIKKNEIKEKINKLEALYDQGVLSEEELQEVVQIKKAALLEKNQEIEEFVASESEFLGKGLKVIELMQFAFNFMSLPGNELQKARLAKIVLSNPVLNSGTLEYHYQNPFDNLLKSLTSKSWWALTGSNRRHLPCKGSALPAELNAHLKSERLN